MICLTFVEGALPTFSKNVTHCYWRYDSLPLHPLTVAEDVSHYYCFCASPILHIVTITEDTTHDYYTSSSLPIIWVGTLAVWFTQTLINCSFIEDLNMGWFSAKFRQIFREVNFLRQYQKKLYSFWDIQ